MQAVLIRDSGVHAVTSREGAVLAVTLRSKFRDYEKALQDLAKDVQALQQDEKTTEEATKEHLRMMAGLYLE